VTTVFALETTVFKSERFVARGPGLSRDAMEHKC